MATPQNLVTCYLDSIFRHRHKNGMMSALTCSNCPQVQSTANSMQKKKQNKTGSDIRVHPCHALPVNKVNEVVKCHVIQLHKNMKFILFIINTI